MLTGLKAASLLSFHKSKFRDFAGLLAVYEPCFKCKGISMFKVSEGEDYVLLLFYRAGALWRDLNRAKAKEILVQCGYRIEDTLQEKLDFLRMRMQIRKSFPHEIGLFLGYPAEDVAGFISHKGHDFVIAVIGKSMSTKEKLERYLICMLIVLRSFVTA